MYLQGGFPPELERTLQWVDRAGVGQPLQLPTAPYQAVRLSPDGQKLAFYTLGVDGSAVWVHDILRGGQNRLVAEGYQEGGIWTPDGKRVAFLSITGSSRDVAWRPADSSAPLEVLVSGVQSRYPLSFTPDGSHLAGIEFGQETAFDIWVVSMDGDRKPQAHVSTKASESAPAFSPDGRWLAYVSGDSGRLEVYVQPYPGPGARTAISTAGGIGPAWSRDGRELFYTSFPPSPDGRIKMMAVPVTMDTQLRAGAPKVLFEGRYVSSPPLRVYDVAPDGKRFLMIQDVERPPLKPTHMVLVQNWFEELKARVPKN